METKGLDDILNDEGQEPIAEPIVEPKSEIHEERGIADRPRGPDGKFAPKDTGVKPQEPQAAAPAADGASPAPEPANVPETALLGERRRRQEAERRLQFMEEQLRQLKTAPQQPSNEPPGEFWDAPEQFLERRFNTFGETLIQQWEQRQLVSKANQSEAVARAKYADYDEVIDEFHQAAKDNPRLAAEMFNAPDPAEFAYKRAKQARALADAGDLDAYREKIIAEYKASLLADTPLRPSLPVTTADDRSVSARDAPVFAGAPALGDILKS